MFLSPRLTAARAMGSLLAVAVAITIAIVIDRLSDE
jgi:hypothetical protein